MDGGRFELRDVPGMVPSQAEVDRMALEMAREMFPHKFEREQWAAHGVKLVAVADREVGSSPLGRLFAAIRELRAAYEALKLDE